MQINSQEKKQLRVPKLELLRGSLRDIFTSLRPWAACLILLLGVGCVGGNAEADSTVDQEIQGNGLVNVEEKFEFERIEDLCILILSGDLDVEGITVTREKVGDTNVETCMVAVDIGNVYLPDGRRVIVHTSFTKQNLPDPDDYIFLMESSGVQIRAVTNDGKTFGANWLAIEN